VGVNTALSVSVDDELFITCKSTVTEKHLEYQSLLHMNSKTSVVIDFID